ncbi:MAG: cupin domain-containing protein [Pseudolabrys sp.]|nr:cupin domain-containing protein [Pseudolabrys sp.]
MLKKSLVAVGLIAFALGGAVYAQNPPVSPSPVKRTMVGKAEVPGSNYEAVTAIVEIAPGFKAGRHFHPGVVYGQVLEGEFWIAIDGQPEKTLKAGESIDLPMKVVHNEGAGPSGVKLVATYVVEKGQPLVNPVK